MSFLLKISRRGSFKGKLTPEDELKGLIEKQKWGKVSKFIDGEGGEELAKKIRFEDNWNILHKTIDLDAPSQLIQKLVDTNPEMLEEKETSRNWYALHVAARANVREETMEIVLKSFPWALAELDINDRTPLHVACLYADITYSMIELYVDRFSEALQMEDKFGKTPVELALFRGEKWVIPKPVFKKLQRVTARNARDSYKTLKEGSRRFVGADLDSKFQERKISYTSTLSGSNQGSDRTYAITE
jgi:hypothetical protein